MIGVFGYLFLLFKNFFSFYKRFYMEIIIYGVRDEYYEIISYGVVYLVLDNWSWY